MESEDSRDASSGSDSEVKGPRSPSPVSSGDSRSSGERIHRGSSGPRSPSPEGSDKSSAHSSPERPKSPNEGPLSPDHSRSASPSSSVSSPKNNMEEDKQSVKSSSSNNSSSGRHSVASSKSGRGSNASSKSGKQSNVSSKSGRRRAKSPSNNQSSSGSSSSSNDSEDSDGEKASIKVKNEEGDNSEGEIEPEKGKATNNEQNESKLKTAAKVELAHEDLSDVSDLESVGQQSEEEVKESAKETDVKVEDTIPKTPAEKLQVPEKSSKPEEGEEQLDFEAEDGECVDETSKPKSVSEAGDVEEKEAPEEGEDLEEGEVTDDEEIRPEEVEPRPVCRFYSRGQCTWGASCRFLHPGVTDKGNYTMFDIIRPLVPGATGYGVSDYRDERPPLYGMPGRGEVPVIESAWERGLRTAKEMMRKAIKRKEQDMDFEEKKMNLTLSQDEFDKENGYYTRAPSPITVDPLPARHYVIRRTPVDYPVRQAEDYYARRMHYEPEPRTVRIEPEFPVPRERVRTYRELPAHRMPDYYDNKYEKYEEPPVSGSTKAKHTRPKREVIVQRVDNSGRGDEWADPWMRSKSPGAKGRTHGTRRKTYSSGSSYSSSSSSRSSSGSSRSSYHRDSHSRSRSPSRLRRRGKSPSSRSHRNPHKAVSPSVIVSEKKAANERALLMNPPAPSQKRKEVRPPSPGMMIKASQNPPAPSKVVVDEFGRTRERTKHDIKHAEEDRKKLAVAAAAIAARVKGGRSSRSSSGSDSSGSSSSDSDSSYSSSSSSRETTPASKHKENRMDLAAIALKAKAIDALKQGGEKRQIKLTLKNPIGRKLGVSDLNELARKPSTETPTQGKKRPATSPTDGEIAAKVAAVGKAAMANKKSTSRREELLKQLKAVEDAIAKKRSKIN